MTSTVLRVFVEKSFDINFGCLKFAKKFYCFGSVGKGGLHFKVNISFFFFEQPNLITLNYILVQFQRFFIVNPHFKRLIMDKHFTVIVTILQELNKQ